MKKYPLQFNVLSFSSGRDWWFRPALSLGSTFPSEDSDPAPEGKPSLNILAGCCHVLDVGKVSGKCV